MLKTLYEFEKDNKNIYDDVREFCKSERINEEYFRASAGQKGLKHKLVDIIRKIIDLVNKEKVYEKTNSVNPSLLKNTYGIRINIKQKDAYNNGK